MEVKYTFMSAGPIGIRVLENMQLKSDARVPYKQIMANIESIATEKEYLKNNNSIFSHI